MQIIDRSHAQIGLPCDMKREIYHYCYTSRGYTVDEIMMIAKGTRRNKFMKLRLKLELGEWYNFNVNVSFLRGGGWYGKKLPTSVFGGGTLAESQYLRYYNGLTHYSKKINDPENDYIEKLIEQGDNRRYRDV